MEKKNIEGMSPRPHPRIVIKIKRLKLTILEASGKSVTSSLLIDGVTRFKHYLEWRGSPELSGVYTMFVVLSPPR